jgi:cysteine desulfurase/selenocysteine lyase
MRSKSFTENNYFDKLDFVYFDSATKNLVPNFIKDQYLFPDKDINWSREIIKNFIGAEKSKEIIFTSNNSHSISLIISGLEKIWRSNDIILVPESENSTNLLSWKKFAEKIGCHFETINIIKDGRLDLGHLEEVLINSNGKVLFSTSHVSSVTGYVQPLNEVFEMIKEYEGFTVLDATHSITHESINVCENLVDFLFFHSANTYNFEGIGVLYAKQKLLEKIDPIFLETFDILPYPQKLESKYSNFNGIVSLSKSIEWISGLGLDNIKSKYLLINANIQMELNNIDSIDVFHPNFYKGGIISFKVKNKYSLDIAYSLNKQGIKVSSGHFDSELLLDKEVVRLSWGLHTTKEDIELLSNALKLAINT